jgi:hypothetical protein
MQVPKPAEDYCPLAAAPPEALYSLQVAAFYGPQNEGRTFQESAIMLARELREKNKLEAYVNHGETCSVVCVGSFPPEAIETPRRMPSISTDPRDLVQGKISVEDIARLTKVVDPNARALQQQFPHMLYNGAERWQWIHREIAPRQWTHRKEYYPSMFVTIPNRKVNEQGQVVIVPTIR